VKLILNQTVCFDVKTEKDYEEFLELLNKHSVRYCIITSIKGLDFSNIWQNRVQGAYGNQTVNFIDRRNLVKSKKISNRTQDKADLELLLSDE
jgi:hypothetical protein